MTLTPRIRFRVLQRDGFTCRYCGRKPPEVTLHVDHIVPRSSGGSDDEENLIAACSTCNHGKAARMLPAIEAEREIGDTRDPHWDVTDALICIVEILKECDRRRLIDTLPKEFAERIWTSTMEGEFAILESGLVREDSTWAKRIDEFRENAVWTAKWMEEQMRNDGRK